MNINNRFKWQILYDDYGYYVPGFFFIKLNKELWEGIRPQDFSKEEFATLVHEYVHFLQDITTTRGISLFSYVSKILQLNFNVAAEKCGNEIMLPFNLDKQNVSNLSVEIDLQSFYQGDDLFKKIHHVNCVKREIEEYFFDVIPEEKLYKISIYYNDVDNPFYFGQSAIAESMAYTIEHEAFGAKGRTREFPYNACEMVCEMVYPRALDNKAVFVAIMELSLMHYHSGDMFYKIIECMRNENMTFSNVGEFENYFLERTYHLWDDMEKGFNEVDECIDFLYPLDVPVFKESREFIKKAFQEGCGSRRNSGLFISKLLESSNSYSEFIKLMNQYGIPPIGDSENSLFAGADLSSMLGPKSIFDFFNGRSEDDNKCLIYPYCKAQGLENFNEEECLHHPWTQSAKERLCTFGAYWTKYSLEGKTVKRAWEFGS